MGREQRGLQARVELTGAAAPPSQREVQCWASMRAAHPGRLLLAVERLQRRVRDPRAKYEQSLLVLEAAKREKVYTKVHARR